VERVDDGEVVAAPVVGGEVEGVEAPKKPLPGDDDDMGTEADEEEAGHRKPTSSRRRLFVAASSSWSCSMGDAKLLLLAVALVVDVGCSMVAEVFRVVVPSKEKDPAAEDGAAPVVVVAGSVVLLKFTKEGGERSKGWAMCVVEW
jgi:hypothetical protein